MEHPQLFKGNCIILKYEGFFCSDTSEPAVIAYSVAPVYFFPTFGNAYIPLENELAICKQVSNYIVLALISC